MWFVNLMTNNPVYFPISNGLYEVALSLRPLGFDFGNPEYDQKIFHYYSNSADYFQNKSNCLNERKEKYVTKFNLSSERREALIQFLVERLLTEHPTLFSRNENQFHFSMLNKTLDLKQSDRQSLLDELCMLVQEDVALVCREGNNDFISYLHLCSPSHWAAEDKIGKNFFEVHVPIPGIEKINAKADRIIEMMINKGPFIRFIWSFVTDTRLNHHPIAPNGIDPVDWKGRSFNKDAEVPFQLRIERQVVYGIPELDASVFTIGVNFIPGDVVKNNPHYRDQLKSALLSMSPESRVYKGVAHCFDDLMAYLE